jgi:hypothetical protein
LAAVTKTADPAAVAQQPERGGFARKTNPKVSTVMNRLRPLIFLPASKPTASCTIAAVFTL